MPLLNASQLRGLIAQGKIEAAIEALLATARARHDTALETEIVQQSARWKTLQRERRQNIIDDDDARRTEARITQAVLDIISALPTAGTPDADILPPETDDPPVALEPGQPVTPGPARPQPVADRPAGSSAAPASGSTPAGAQAGMPRWSLIAGGVALLLVFGAVLWTPEPTAQQFIVYQIMLALGAAGVAAVIPGFLNIKYKDIISAGGALAIFALVLYFTGRATDMAPFDFTVYVHGPEGKHDIVLEDEGRLILDLGGDRRPARIGENGRTVFSGIPAQFRGRELTLGLQAEGYKAAQPNAMHRLEPDGVAYLEVAPLAMPAPGEEAKAADSQE